MKNRVWMAIRVGLLTLICGCSSPSEPEWEWTPLESDVTIHIGEMIDPITLEMVEPGVLITLETVKVYPVLCYDISAVRRIEGHIIAVSLGDIGHRLGVACAAQPGPAVARMWLGDLPNGTFELRVDSRFGEDVYEIELSSDSMTLTAIREQGFTLLAEETVERVRQGWPTALAKPSKRLSDVTGVR